MKFLRKGLLLLFLLPALFLIEGAGFLSVILSGAKDLLAFHVMTQTLLVKGRKSPKDGKDE